MNVELISVGDEIISGYTVDTNSVFIARELARIGLNVTFKAAVGDDPKTMEAVFHQALSRSDIIIATGGLGPTDDDITKRVICKVFKRNLVFHEEIVEDLKKRFEERGLNMPAINQNQGLLPQGAEFLPNKYGSAIGIVIKENNKVFVSLPGVPFEMEQMVRDELLPYLQNNFKLDTVYCRVLNTIGIFESALAEKITPHLKIPDNTKLAYLPSPRGIKLRLIAIDSNAKRAKETVDKVADQIYAIAGDYIFGEGDPRLEEVIGQLLKDSNATLAVAESCTAGLLAKTITDVAGSSGWFDRGIVSYSNRSKTDLLDVPPEIIEEFGAVSAETAEAMALALKEKSEVDYSLSITGVAGPSGGTDAKPVGTVYIGLATPDNVMTKKYNLGNKREINRIRATYTALNLLRKALLEK